MTFYYGLHLMTFKDNATQKKKVFQEKKGKEVSFHRHLTQISPLRKRQQHDILLAIMSYRADSKLGEFPSARLHSEDISSEKLAGTT
jgi:hypothetical protein